MKTMTPHSNLQAGGLSLLRRLFGGKPRCGKCFPLVAAMLLLMAFAQSALALPENFTRETVLANLDEPTYVTTMPDGNMMLLEKSGFITMFDPAVLPATRSTVILLEGVQTPFERGATTLVLDPDFANNGYFYVYYAKRTDTETDTYNRIGRFTFELGTASRASEVLVWEDNEPASECCHYGGGMDFGPDGMLYLATGEEFDPPQAQDLGRAGGKVIRLDVSQLDTVGPWTRGGNNDHLIPDDNPFIDGNGGNLDEIWAYGLRNPFRAHWDIPGGRFYIGEVGGNIQQTAQEDLHIGRSGANYGWPDCEGNCDNPAFDDPIFTYGHTGATPDGGAIAAGVTYRADQYPNSFNGVFFIADYATSELTYLAFNADGSVSSQNEFDENLGAPVAMEIGPEGSLYVVDFIGNLFRYTFNSGNQAPVISAANATPTAGAAPLLVNFSATATDPEGDALEYTWVFGDGEEATGANVTHQYAANGQFLAFVRVSDPTRSTLSDQIAIQVGTPPVITIDSPADGMTFAAGDTINFAATVQNATVSPPYTFEWDIDFIHNGHTHPTLSTADQNGSFPINTEGHDYHDDTGFLLSLTVTDAQGLQTTEEVTVRPRKVDLNLATVPAGLDIFIDGVPITAPISYDTAANFNHLISVSGTVCENGLQYQFDNWSDGGTRAHMVNVGNADLTLTATFNETGACDQISTDGLIAHFESDAGVVSNGTELLAWNDLSGNNNNLDAVFGDPELIPNALNGNPVLDFDGTEDLMRRSGGLSGFATGGNNRTMFVIANYRGTGYGGVAYGNAADNQTFGLVVTPDGRLAVQAWGTANDFTSVAAGTGQGWLLQSAVVNGDQMTHFVNGNLVDSRTHTYATQMDNLVVGAEIDENPSVDMQLAAVVIYNRALSPNERTDVEDFLRNKYLNTGDPGTPPVAGEVPDQGLVAHYEADQQVVFGNENRVASWGDQSGTGNILNGVGNPRLVDDALNGRPVIRFDGVNSKLERLANLNGLPAGNNDRTMYMVARYTSTGIGGAAYGNQQDNETFGLVVTAAGDLAIQGWGAVNDFDSGVDGTGQGFLVQSATFANGTLTHYLNGDVLSTQAHTFATNPDKIVVGAEIDGIPFMNMDVAAIYIYDRALSAEERAQLDAFIQAKYFGATTGTETLALNNSESLFNGETIAIDVLENDVDPLGLDPATVMIVQAPANGTATANADGTVSYTHNGNIVIADSFVYTVANVNGMTSNEATVSLTILGRDALPLGTPTAFASARSSLRKMPAASSHTAATATGNESSTEAVESQATSESAQSGESASNSDAPTLELSNSTTALVTEGQLTVNGLVGHFEAHHGVARNSQGTVSSWADGSGNNNHLSAVGDPLAAVSSASGLPVVAFDGSDDALTRSAPLSSFPLGAADRSVYLVVSYDGVGVGGFSYGGANSNQAFGIGVDSNGALSVTGYERDEASLDSGTGAGMLVQSIRLEANELTHSIGLTIIDSASHNFDTTVGPLVLGADLDLNPHVQMQVAALLVYDRALTDAEHEATVNYLQQRYIPQ